MMPLGTVRPAALTRTATSLPGISAPAWLAWSGVWGRGVPLLGKERPFVVPARLVETSLTNPARFAVLQRVSGHPPRCRGGRVAMSAKEAGDHGFTAG